MLSARLMLLNAYAALLHRLRPNAGLTRLSFNSITNALFSGVEGPLQARLPSDVMIEVDPDEYHGRILWLAGSNDWKVSRTVNVMLRRGDVLLDIGANLGSIGFAALDIVGPAGAVHFFEPQSLVADRLQAAIARTGQKNLLLHRVALSDADGTVTLAGPTHHRGMATILPPSELERPRDLSETVEMRDAERMVPALLEGRPFGVKIDIEGAEPRVLPGILTQPDLRFVVFEGDQNQEWLWDFFSTHGFAVYGLSRTPLKSSVGPVARFQDWSMYHDFISVPKAEGLPDRIVPLRRFAQVVASSEASRK